MSASVNIASAAILTKLNEPLEIGEIEIPRVLRGQVLVKILYSGVCRSQLMEVNGGRGDDPWLPHLLGHEGSGIVVAIGDGVKKVAVGDEVILGWIKGTGLDAPGAKYSWNGRLVNSGGVTTFSNYSIVSENRLVKKPPNLEFDSAVLFGCALLTGAGMVYNQITPTAESSVVVVGLGGIGLSAVMALKTIGVKKIIAVDISNDKLLFAKIIGATHVLNSSDVNLQSHIHEITNGGADYCIESAGQIKTIELGFSLISAVGVLLFASHPPGYEKISLSPHELISGKSIRGSWGGASFPDRDVPIFFNNFNKANINIKSLITKTYSLDSINLALLDLESGKVFRPLIKMEHS